MDHHPNANDIDRRLKLDRELRGLLQDTLDCGQIYYQPPENVRMQYPAIVYKQNTMNVRYANDRSYHIRDEYQVIAISDDPESPLPRAIQEHFSLCAPGRKYMADNLYHFPFTIYY